MGLRPLTGHAVAFTGFHRADFRGSDSIGSAGRSPEPREPLPASASSKRRGALVSVGFRVFENPFS
jgi:hypothetical protein